MPIHRGRDAKGPYVQWGGHGKKYYYGPKFQLKTLADARAAAGRQAAAAYAHGYRGK
jgi:hypothetical protein